MKNVQSASVIFILVTGLLSCQKEASNFETAPSAATSSGTLWQSDAQEIFTQKTTSVTKTNNDSSITERNRSFDKAFTYSAADCSGELVDLTGTLNYITTDVFDQNGNEISLKTHLNLHGTGKTQDGETFTVHETSEENFSLAGAKAGGHFLVKERWRTSHHSGTIIFDFTGKFDAVTYTYNVHVAAITYKCG